MKNSSSKNNIKDICPGCRDRNKKPLPVSCACKKVRYCSTRCQENMFASHIKECEVDPVENVRSKVLQLKLDYSSCFS